jgi:hypothetical protein
LKPEAPPDAGGLHAPSEAQDGVTRWCDVRMPPTFEIAARWLDGRLIVALAAGKSAPAAACRGAGLEGDASLRARPN